MNDFILISFLLLFVPAGQAGMKITVIRGSEKIIPELIRTLEPQFQN